MTAISGRAKRSLGLAACLAALAAAAAPPARADLDFGRLVMGRATYPARSWVLESYNTYAANKLRDASGDTVRFNTELDHGFTDRLSGDVGFQTDQSRRDGVRPGNASGAVRWLAIESPLQVAGVAEYRPSLRRKGDELEFGAEAVKNLEDWSLLGQAAAESVKDEGRARRLDGLLILGPIYRFGLNGILGAQWYYTTQGVNSVAAELGGAIGSRLFLGLEPRFGLSRGAPDFQLQVQLHVYFGAYSRQAYELQ